MLDASLFASSRQVNVYGNSASKNEADIERPETDSGFPGNTFKITG